jgi:carbamoyl-phosphate synthase small subunit
VQGIKRVDIPAYSFQGHPEASPGPHDAKYLFDAFIKAMASEGTGDDVAVDVVKGGAV